MIVWSFGSLAKVNGCDGLYLASACIIDADGFSAKFASSRALVLAKCLVLILRQRAVRW